MIVATYCSPCHQKWNRTMKLMHSWFWYYVTWGKGIHSPKIIVDYPIIHSRRTINVQEMNPHCSLAPASIMSHDLKRIWDNVWGSYVFKYKINKTNRRPFSQWQSNN
jgi:hypothetical protein